VCDKAQQIEPADPEVDEEWLRGTSEPDIRAVSAIRMDTVGGWQVEISVMEFVRTDPLESELRQRITSALQGVSGVTSAEEEDRETWFITGALSGKALVEAAAQVVDDLADRTRAYLSGLHRTASQRPRAGLA
jgi:hypothetical protein